MRQLFKLNLFITALIAASTAPAMSFAASPEAVAAWSGPINNGHAVYTSQQLDGEWSEPTLIAQSKNRILSTAIGSYSFNKATRKTNDPVSMLAVWTEVIGPKLVLKFADSRNGVWASAKTLSALGGENLGPTIVHDLAGNAWVFWSSNVTDNDEIYYSRRVDGVWSNAQMVNKANTYPDILPRAYLDKNGGVAVEWRFLSPLLNTYDSRKKVFALEPELKPTMAQLADENKDVETTSLEAPAEAYTAYTVNLHYPHNIHDQSVYVNQPR